MNVFVSMNPEGELVVTPAERHREKLDAFQRSIEQAGGSYADLERVFRFPF